MFPSVMEEDGNDTYTTKDEEFVAALTPILSLPDDLLLSCVARVSILYYPTLSLVSKSFRSLISSPELRKTRLSLGRKEACLYVCFQSDPNPNPCWFILCRKPDRTLINGSSGNVFVPSSCPNSDFNIEELSYGLSWCNFFCTIENATCSNQDGVLLYRWRDVTGKQEWKKLELKGLKGLPDIERHDDYFQLVDYGGKLAILWSELCGEKKVIRCAVIALSFERRNIGEIHGEVEWWDEVLAVPKSYKSGYAVCSR
ncbi:unnamed protein product [Microthlaspi erraticum]|uniref:F-box domain-containing protein n=1 Tax=Microthlaspi erraticum TaxID=1685480 RepID=A0A6D2I6G6_9BRAS|nr:unnamed protein product [Microthlaspi erraticum]